MKAKLVKTYSNRVRIYELSKPIYKGKSDLKDEVCIEESLKELYERLKPEYQESALQYKKEGCYYVAISEAHTHIETLVFPAIRVTDSSYAWSHDDIGGKHTMMINGGDPSSIYQDEVYLRRLAQLNNYNYESIHRHGTKP